MEKDCKHATKPRSLREFFRSVFFWRPFLGIAAGALLGFLYYYFIGCNSGSCAITSNPYNSIIMGGVFGFLITGTQPSCNCNK